MCVVKQRTSSCHNVIQSSVAYSQGLQLFHKLMVYKPMVYKPMVYKIMVYTLLIYNPSVKGDLQGRGAMQGKRVRAGVGVRWGHIQSVLHS